MYEKWLKLLTNVLLFKGIPSQELILMLNCIRPQLISVKKNEFIVLAGDSFTGIGVILQGEASVLKENAAGDRVVMTMLKSGDMFGEIAAFSEMDKWPASVKAQANCEVLIVSPEKIVGHCEKMCISHRMLINNMLKIVSQKALILNKKVEYLVIKGMREKIATFLLETYKKTGQTIFMIHMNRNELADFLNVSRPSMSREMARMKEDGLIDFHKASIKILNLEGLKACIRK